MSNKTWRTLIRVVSVQEETVEVVIPGCGYDKTFFVSKSVIPFEVEVDFRFHAKANLDAETSEELMLSDFKNF